MRILFPPKKLSTLGKYKNKFCAKCAYKLIENLFFDHKMNLIVLKFSKWHQGNQSSQKTDTFQYIDILLFHSGLKTITFIIFFYWKPLFEISCIILIVKQKLKVNINQILFTIINLV